MSIKSNVCVFFFNYIEHTLVDQDHVFVKIQSTIFTSSKIGCCVFLNKSISAEFASWI